MYMCISFNASPLLRLLLIEMVLSEPQILNAQTFYDVIILDYTAVVIAVCIFGND